MNELTGADADRFLQQLNAQLSEVVSVPAPGGEFSISMNRGMDEAKRLGQAKAMLHDMIESTEESLLHPREGFSNDLLVRPSQLATGIDDVAARLEYETRHKEMLDLQKATKEAVERAAGNSQGAKDAAERAAASIDEIKGKMLALWRRWLYDEPYKPGRTRETPPAGKNLCAPMNDALFAYWKSFQNGKLDGTLSVQYYDEHIVERKRKRNANEFWTTHGADVVYTAQDGTQYTLQDLCPTVEDVQRMIDRNNKAIKRAKGKNGQSADKQKI